MAASQTPPPQSPPHPPSPPPRDPSMRPVLEIVVIPRPAELNATDEALFSLALVTVVGGNRPTVSPAEVWGQLESFYHIAQESFTVSRYAPEDFLLQHPR